jgi:hypothetical protein
MKSVTAENVTLPCRVVLDGVEWDVRGRHRVRPRTVKHGWYNTCNSKGTVVDRLPGTHYHPQMDQPCTGVHLNLRNANGEVQILRDVDPAQTFEVVT